ncbi:DNA gyrase inhibitor YacG [Phaeobacter marinintestinus]|uniref:DNA gyrase inhibitor YacG n=1 Tax=Falsiphaeobacter marinintestinus TaxID=1492905 RepID=UPI0011B5A3E0|nr:DNA gyrase inhibitor YacG [Phaeobacter marinintestinus]
MSCPICKKPTMPDWRPFCSKRCADIDLGNWFGERYSVPSDDPEDAEKVQEATEPTPPRLH